jgi:hypothetical protein
LEAGIDAPSSCAAREIDMGRRGSRAGLGSGAGVGALPCPMRKDGRGTCWTGVGSVSRRSRTFIEGARMGVRMAVGVDTRILVRWCRGRGSENGGGTTRESWKA